MELLKSRHSDSHVSDERGLGKMIESRSQISRMAFEMVWEKLNQDWPW